MTNIVRIKSPASKLSKEQRISELFDSISKWVYSEPLIALVRLFGGDDSRINQINDLKDYIVWLNDFVKVWDYRKIQAKGGERWNISDEAFVRENHDDIMCAIGRLGLLNNGDIWNKPDFIIPLGGARLANLLRPVKAKEFIDLNKWEGVQVVALSGMRQISDVELSYLKKYAPQAKTEYEAINKGLEKAFNITNDYREEIEDNENINLKSAIREYTDRYERCKIFSLSAPSSVSERRADSYDTFKFFLDKFEVKKGEKLLLVTSCIYVPFQLLKFMDLAIEGEFEVECVGVESSALNNSVINTSNYLQEIKATINAIYSLAQIYL